MCLAVIGENGPAIIAATQQLNSALLKYGVFFGSVPKWRLVVANKWPTMMLQHLTS